MEGASTITQQLAKNLFLYKDQTYTRKVNEWAVALQIERFYTKRQILEMYMNYVFLGAGAYGFEAGSRTYFGKSLKDLSLEEAALARRHPEIARVFADPQHGEGKDAPRHRARPDGEIFSREIFTIGGRRRQGKTDQTCRHRLLSVAAEIDRVGLPGRRDPQISRGKVHDPRRPGRAEGLYDDQCRRAKDSDQASFANGSVHSTAGGAGVRIIRTFWLTRTGEPLTDQKEIEKTLTSYKHADWYGDEYDEGEYIKGLVVKVNPGG